MSRIAWSGTRTSRRRRCPSGLRKVWIVTSLGISWAAGCAGHVRMANAQDRRRPAEVLSARNLWKLYTCAVRHGGSVMKRKRNLFVGSTLLALLGTLGVAQQHAARRRRPRRPRAPCRRRGSKSTRCGRSRCPTTGCYGNVIGVGVDSRDHVYIIHRGAGSLEAKEIYAAENPPASECCVPAPPVIEFDADGNFVRAWGGPGTGLRMARVESRHHARHRRATCSSAATAATTATS